MIFLNLGGALSGWSWRGPFLVYLSGILLLPYAWAVLIEPRRNRPRREGVTDPPVSVDYWRTGLAYFLGLISMALFYLFPAQLPFLLSQHDEVSGVAIGLAISAAPLTSALVSFSYGYLKPFFSVITLYVLAFLLSAVGFLVVGVTASYSITVAGAALAGLGFGLFMPNTTVWLMRITPRQRGAACSAASRRPSFSASSYRLWRLRRWPSGSPPYGMSLLHPPSFAA